MIYFLVLLKYMRYNILRLSQATNATRYYPVRVIEGCHYCLDFCFQTYTLSVAILGRSVAIMGLRQGYIRSESVAATFDSHHTIANS